MNELLKMSIDIHMIFVFTTLLLAIINLYIIKFYDNYIVMTKRYELYTLLYYLSLSVVIFTGLIILAIYKFKIKILIYIMMVVTMIVIISSFKTHKLFKKTRLKDINSQNVFKEYAVKKFGIDALLILFTTILALAVKS